MLRNLDFILRSLYAMLRSMDFILPYEATEE